MRKINKNIEKNPRLEECISAILDGNNVQEVLSRFEGISITDLYNYSSNDSKQSNSLSESIGKYIFEQNPNLDEYLNLFSDDRKDPLDTVLLGLNETARPFRKNPDTDIMKKLDSDMKTMKKYKEPFKDVNRYGVLDSSTNEMKYATSSEISTTLDFIKSEHANAIDKLGFIPDYMVSQYIREYLKQDSEKSNASEILGDIKVPKPAYPLRADLMKRIQEKQERKVHLVSEMNDLDRYIDFMENQKGMTAEREDK